MEHNLITLMNTVAEIEISYKPIIQASMRPKVQRSKESYQLFIETWDKSKLDYVEQFKVMLLNRANRVLGICTLTTGSTIGTVADPQQLFAIALKANASSVIMAHNHPSGSTTPSVSDTDLTLRMKKAGEVVNVKVLDHLIVTSEFYYSFADEGTL